MKIVISYRQADTGAFTGRLFDRLSAHYGPESVFMDIDSIPFGVDFREHIEREIESSDIVVVVIGPRWLGEGKTRRIDDERDFVRIEVELALRRDIPIVPILVDGARMPAPEELPSPLKGLAFRNAAPINAGRDFHPHVDRLIKSMDRAKAIYDFSRPSILLAPEVASVMAGAQARSANAASGSQVSQQRAIFNNLAFLKRILLHNVVFFERHLPVLPVVVGACVLVLGAFLLFYIRLNEYTIEVTHAASELWPSSPIVISRRVLPPPLPPPQSSED